ncbi:14023_t:CDS:1, partial [Gigaspora margarita]
LYFNPNYPSTDKIIQRNFATIATIFNESISSTREYNCLKDVT